MSYLRTPTRRAALRGLATTAAIPLMGPLMGAPTLARTAEQVQANRRKVNIAGRQRMLSQRMSRAIAYIALGIERERHFQMLETAHGEFGKALAGLRVGDADLGLPRESNAIVLSAINSVEGIWAVFGNVIAQIAAQRTVSFAELKAVARSNMTLLFTSDNVVKTMVEQFGDGDQVVGLAISINIAGRQRMLSQKMAKEAALIGLRYEPEATRESLEGTMELFDVSLEALLNGLPGITLPTPPDFVRIKLLEVQNIWRDYRQIISTVARSGDATDFDLLAIGAQADPLLKTMNDAVFLYEDVASV